MNMHIQLEKQLAALSGHEPGLCRKVYTLCRPYMKDQSQDETEWLSGLCAHLSDNMFPDEAHPAVHLTEDEQFYLAALEPVFKQNIQEFDPFLDLLTLRGIQRDESRVEEQYKHFRRAVRSAHLMALMRITREVQIYDPCAHTIGVHNVAFHTALYASKAGIQVDLPLVSAAALGHDIGKFGCRGNDSYRIPYLHYYYTWQWFSENGMEDIGYISANHSTWDLEFENLPIESLLLIYADFRVRGIKNADGKEEMHIYSLEDSYQAIFTKLYNMTPEKEKRYRTVYYKLRDFEELLKSYGVPTELDVNELLPVQPRDCALLSREDAIRQTSNTALIRSIDLMRLVSTDKAFAALLEQAKAEKTLQRIRTFLLLFREYSTYLSTANKRLLLNLTYELLAHSDGDVRRIAGDLMGQVLANSGPKYRKERPVADHENIMTPTMMSLLDEAQELFSYYIRIMLNPVRETTAKHAFRIRNSLKIVVESFFRNCDEKDVPAFLEILTDCIKEAGGRERFTLTDMLVHIPEQYLPLLDWSVIKPFLEENLGEQNTDLGNCTARTVRKLAATIPELRDIVPPLKPVSSKELGDLYLSNLKNAVHWTVKLTQMEQICEYVAGNPDHAFQAALHFSNILSVSEHLPVRLASGTHLTEMAGMLSNQQINEIVIDLSRTLETGQEQITRFVAPFLGDLICRLKTKERQEAISYLESLVKSTSYRSAEASMRVIGAIINELLAGKKRVPKASAPTITWLMGLLITGISHYEDSVHQLALRVLCRDVLCSSRLTPELRGQLFMQVNKKVLTILAEPRNGRLNFFNSAAMLNCIYRFQIEYEVTIGKFPKEEEKPVAFFPGTFDPFTVGHKAIVDEIHKQGFEVYLAVDEFSWSKYTMPKLRRRKIVQMAIADRPDAYLFPDEIPVNIAMPEDLAMLQSLFPGRDVYLAVGSDVIRNASAYKKNLPGGVQEFNHLIFCRRSQKKSYADEISGKTMVLKLPREMEDVSSTRIREYIDEKLDISMLVDPVVQSYIYEYGLYVRAPESKEILRLQELYFRSTYNEQQDAEVRLYGRPERLLGSVAAHSQQSSELYELLHSTEAAGYVRRHTSGRLLWIDKVEADEHILPDITRLLLNELLARALQHDFAHAVCKCTTQEETLRTALYQLGFRPVPNCEELYVVDMRQPLMLMQDVLLCIKQPHQNDPRIRAAVYESRRKLRRQLSDMYPGTLILAFDEEMLNQALLEHVVKYNGMEGVAESGVLGPAMCVPYGRMLSEVRVPNTVTKTLHAEKAYIRDLSGFEIEEYPGYSPLSGQVRTLRAFRRPVILVDDFLHTGNRIKKLDKVFRKEGLKPEMVIVGVLSGRGKDLMKEQHREVAAEYFIPNLRHWIVESNIYPFLGGDHVQGRHVRQNLLPSMNLIMPYCYPTFFHDVDQQQVLDLSETALENAACILEALERTHQDLFNTTLTIRHLREALHKPRLPEENAALKFDYSLLASFYVRETQRQLARIARRKTEYNEI